MMVSLLEKQSDYELGAKVNIFEVILDPARASNAISYEYACRRYCIQSFPVRFSPSYMKSDSVRVLVYHFVINLRSVKLSPS